MIYRYNRAEGFIAYQHGATQRRLHPNGTLESKAAIQLIEDETVPLLERIEAMQTQLDVYALREPEYQKFMIKKDARIAALEAWLTVAWQYTPTNLLPKELYDSFGGQVMDGDSTQELIKAFLAKKAGDHE